MAAARKRKRPPRHMRQPVAEMIGRAASPLAQLSIYRSRSAIYSVDETVPDYAFYDMLRRGKQPGYKLGALFAKRIEHIFAMWTWGRGVTVSVVEDDGAPMVKDADSDSPTSEDGRTYTDGKLADFFDAHHAQLMTVKEDSLGLGMQYIFVNADGTLSVPSPDTVEETRDPLDYRIVTAVTITTKLPSGWTVTDQYTPLARTITYKKGEETLVQVYPNLIGRLNYVRVPYGMSGNETFGHSIHEDLLKLYDQYDDVIHKQLDGAKLLGNPILAFTGMEDLTAVIDANKPIETETYLDRDGNEVNRPMLNVDSNSVMLIGKGGDGKFIAPPTGFTADTQQALKSLFLLLLDRTGIPEFIWGNELSSARASSDTQMMQWAHDIEGMQRADEPWLLELCSIWLAWQALTDPRIVTGQLRAEWPPVLDENQELRLKLLEYASRQNLLTAKTKLELTSLPVDDVDAEIAGGEAEATARAEQEQARTIAAAQAMPRPSAVGEMTGYNEGELTGIVQGAIRQLAGG